MNKELEALNYLKRKLVESNTTFKANYLDTIETALKEYELMKEIRITARFDLAQVNKEHKALEIIKEKRLIVYNPNSKCIETKGYAHDLPQEYEDLLKEVLL